MKPILGVDVGSRYVKLVAAVPGGDRSRIEGAWVFDTPYRLGRAADTAGDQDSVDQESVAQRIVQALAKPITQYTVHVLLPARMVSSVRLAFPKIPEKEVRAVIIREAKAAMIPSPPPDSLFGYARLQEAGMDAKGKADRLRYFVASTRETHVAELLAVFNRLHVTPALITFSPFAYRRVLALAAPEASEVAVIDLGASESTLSIFTTHGLQFFSSLSPLCGGLVAMIAKELSLSKDNAEALLMQYGRQEPADDVQRTLRTLIHPALMRFADESGRVLLYYREQLGGGLVSRIYVTGGGAQLAQIDQLLAARTGTVVEPLKPFQGMRAERVATALGDAPESLFTAAVGLALLEEREAINFLSQTRQAAVRSRRRTIVSLAAISVIAVCIAGLCAWWGVLRAIQTKSQQQLEQQQAMLDANRSFIQQDQDLAAWRTSVTEQLSVLKRLTPLTPDWATLLRELGAIVSPEIVLTDVSIAREQDSGSSAGPERGAPVDQWTPSTAPFGDVGPPGVGVARGSPPQQQEARSPWTMTVSGFAVADFKTFRSLLKQMQSRVEASTVFEAPTITGSSLEASVSSSEGRDSEGGGFSQLKARTFKMTVALTPISPPQPTTP
jgi:type IV pilus assembly protein PilM